jgi:hypothetical protein
MHYLPSLQKFVESGHAIARKIETTNQLRAVGETGECVVLDLVVGYEHVRAASL